MENIGARISRLLAIFILCAGSAHAIEFTAQEKEYIGKTKTVKMCVDPDWAPFEIINKKGEHEGIAADLIALVSKRTGLKIELYPVKTWDESVEASKSGKCQIMSFLNQTPAREKWLIFTEPIFVDPNVFITREEHPFIANAKNLSNESIALPRNTMVAERIQKDYPNIKVIGTGSEEEAVNLVSERKADMTMRSLIIAAYTIKKEGLFNLKIAGQIPEYTNKLRIGVLKNETMLRDILNKGVMTITPQEMEQISNKHVSIKAQTGIDYALVYKVAGGLSLLILIAIYWNRRLAKFNTEISSLQKETATALYQVETLLNNSSEGFLSFGKSLTVNSGYSAECERIFAGDPSGKSVAKLLYPGEPQKEEQLLQNLLRIMSCDDDFKAKMFVSLLPKRFQVGPLTLAAKYKLLGNGDMMTVLTDITEEIALGERVAKEQLRLKFVVSVFKDRADIQNLIKDFRRFLVRGTGEASGVKEELHTFKGLFSQFDFYHLPKALHKAEENPQRNAKKELEAALEADMLTLRQTIGYDPFDAKERLCVDKEALENLEAELSGLSMEQIRDRLGAFRQRPFRELLEQYPRYASALASRIGKEIKPFEITGGDFAVAPDRYLPFARTVIHLIRNAVEHGIEEPDAREELGKSREGNIRIKATLEGGMILLTVEDDGRGIDIQKLIEKASQKGIQIPQNQLLLVFEESLSSKDTATTLSGRGVGMSALKAEADKLGAPIEVHTSANKGTSFLFKIADKQ